MNWTVGRRLMASFTGLLLISVVMGVTDTIGMKILADATQNLYDHPFTVTRAILKVEIGVRTLESTMHAQVIDGTTFQPEQVNKTIKQLEDDINKNINVVNERYLGDKSEIQKIQARLSEWKISRDEALSLLKKGKTKEARKIIYHNELLVREIIGLNVEVSEFADNKADTFLHGAISTASNIIRRSCVLLIVILLTGGLLAIDSIRFVRNNITRQLKESVTQLSSISTSIMATTTQVAAGAAETAASVSETTATVEEVKQTAQLASQKVRSVSDSAQKALLVSQSGRKSVEASMQGMRLIQEQMETIAESIVRLSEQSQSIGEIITTVNDLAEQSNLLAVNAAIEAAKAGEQGRGFAVVAQEIKSMAEQSKQATIQVRTILGDIQKATSTAVLATEQGSKAVQAGVKQTGETGEAIRLMSDSANEVAQAASQIAASSQQQMVGMDQVAQAMENIKLASVQNISGTQQAEVAIQSLHELGQKLSDMIGGRTS